MHSLPSVSHTFLNTGVRRTAESSKNLLPGLRETHCCCQLSGSALAHLAEPMSLQNLSRSTAVVSDFCRLKGTLAGGEVFPGEIKESA